MDRHISYHTSINSEYRAQIRDFESLFIEKQLDIEALERNEKSRPRNYQQYAIPLTKTYDSVVSKSLRVLDDLSLDSSMNAIRQVSLKVSFSLFIPLSFFNSFFFFFLFRKPKNNSAKVSFKSSRRLTILTDLKQPILIGSPSNCILIQIIYVNNVDIFLLSLRITTTTAEYSLPSPTKK